MADNNSVETTDKGVLGKSIMWNTVGSVYYAFCQWVMTVVIIYMTDDYWQVGVFGLAMTVTNSFTSIGSFGMRSFQISDIKKVYSNENYILSRRITCLVAYLACVVYSIAIKSTPKEVICILIYMIIRMVDSTEDVYQGVLQVNWRFDVIGKSFIARGTLQLIAFVGVFLLTQELYITFIVMALCDFAILEFYDKRMTRKIADLGKIGFTLKNKKVWNLLKACSKLVVYYFMSASLATVVRVSIKDICGVEDLGVYSTIASPTIIIQLTASVIYSPFLPGIAKTYLDGNKKKFVGYLKKILLVIIAGFIVLTAGGHFLGHWALELLYNSKIASHDDLLLPLIWCTFLYASVWFFAGILIAIRESTQLIVGVIIAFVLNFIINQPLIHRFGQNGGSYSLVISEVVLMIIYAVIILYDIHRYKEGQKDGNPV